MAKFFNTQEAEPIYIVLFAIRQNNCYFPYNNTTIFTLQGLQNQVYWLRNSQAILNLDLPGAFCGITIHGWPQLCSVYWIVEKIQRNSYKAMDHAFWFTFRAFEYVKKVETWEIRFFHVKFMKMMIGSVNKSWSFV